jgi:thiol-disulfide isomerase/thioredoxin
VGGAQDVDPARVTGIGVEDIQPTVNVFGRVVGPDTGYLWVATWEDIMRLDRDGRPVWVHSTEDGHRKWFEVVESLDPATPIDEPLAAHDRLLRQRQQDEIDRRRAERLAVRAITNEPGAGDTGANEITIESLNYEEIRSAHLARYRLPSPPREYTFLPVGSEAPDIEMVRIADGETVRLSEFHGKVVLVEFWATWCGPCQEPMAKLQEMVEAHPEWEDRVAVLTLSIDREMATAAAHLETNGWRQTRNLWVGPGAWDAEPARQFNLEAVPSFYLVDPDGKIHLAGNPHHTDLAASIANLLR